jgi:Protein of unknown function (DUF3168)
MSLESDIFSALTGLVSGRVYPDVAPYGTTTPYITYQQVGGSAENFLESVFVGKRNARIQINCWASTRASANSLARSVETTVITSTALRATVLGALIATHEPDLVPPLYGTYQDFSIWY